MYMQNTVKLTGSLYYVTSVSSDFPFANHLIYKYFSPKTWSLFAERYKLTEKNLEKIYKIFKMGLFD